VVEADLPAAERRLEAREELRADGGRHDDVARAPDEEPGQSVEQERRLTAGPAAGACRD
jgi:hypothetical protein